MTLTTHALAGAALGALMPQHPVLAFGAGFASHLVLDAVPHWNYHPRSDSLEPKRGGRIFFNKDLVIDLAAICGDGLLGLALGMFFFANPTAAAAVFLGICGGEAPDFLHFLYTRHPKGWLKMFFRFHERIQTEVFAARPWTGFFSQVFCAAVIVLGAKMLLPLL